MIFNGRIACVATVANIVLYIIYKSATMSEGQEAEAREP